MSESPTKQRTSYALGASVSHPGQATCWCGQSQADVHWQGNYRKGRIARACILRCRACGMLRSGPQEGVMAASGDGPDGHFVNAEPNYWEHINADIIAACAAGGPPGPLLEVGANTGMLLDLLAGRGMDDLHGLEPNRQCVAAALQRGLDVVEGWFTQADTPPGPFASIVLSHVLEHIPDLKAALDLLADRLVDGGRVMFFVPNAESWRATSNYSKWGPLNPVDHVWHFTRATLRRLVEQDGRFRVLDVRTTRIRPLRFNRFKRAIWAVRSLLAPRFGKAEQLVLLAEKIPAQAEGNGPR